MWMIINQNQDDYRDTFAVPLESRVSQLSIRANPRKAAIAAN